MAVTPADVATDLGMAAPLENSVQWNQWSLWIGEARLLIAAGPDGHAPLVLDDLDQATLDYVVRKAVCAAADPTVYVDGDGIEVGRPTSSRRVTILSSWWALLVPSADDSYSFSVRPYFEPDVTEPVWW